MIFVHFDPNISDEYDYSPEDERGTPNPLVGRGKRSSTGHRTIVRVHVGFRESNILTIVNMHEHV